MSLRMRHGLVLLALAAAASRYDYTLAPIATPEEQAALRARVVAGAGAGKL